MDHEFVLRRHFLATLTLPDLRLMPFFPFSTPHY
jgi:hypothetical protein